MYSDKCAGLGQAVRDAGCAPISAREPSEIEALIDEQQKLAAQIDSLIDRAVNKFTRVLTDPTPIASCTQNGRVPQTELGRALFAVNQQLEVAVCGLENLTDRSRL